MNVMLPVAVDPEGSGHAYPSILQIQKIPTTVELTVMANPIGNAYVVFATLMVVLLVFLDRKSVV
jgi:hypothetical protein